MQRRSRFPRLRRLMNSSAAAHPYLMGLGFYMATPGRRENRVVPSTVACASVLTHSPPRHRPVLAHGPPRHGPASREAAQSTGDGRRGFNTKVAFGRRRNTYAWRSRSPPTGCPPHARLC